MVSGELAWVRRSYHLVALGVMAAVLVAFAFRAEISDAVADRFDASNAGVRRTWVEGTVGRLNLRPQRDDPAFLLIQGLRVGSASSAGVSISFDLLNLGLANAYPNLAVSMVGANGDPVRQILFSPMDYGHGKRFEKERIDLLVQPRSGELRFTVRAFYGDRP